MQRDIIKKIELLVEMSDTNNHYDSLQEEYNVLKKDIEILKNKIARVKKSMLDKKYINASDRIIDENIKIGLENKIATYEQSLNDILNELEDVSKEEEDYHKIINDLEKEIATSKSFLEALELKLKTIGSKDKSVYSFYEDLIDTTTKEIKENEEKLQTKKNVYEQIEARLASFGENRYILEEKMKKDKNKLEETEETLNNPDSYIDYKMKTKDEENLESLNKELEAMERRKLEIITDPSFIGHDAEELLMEDDRTSALDKIKELITIVNSKPYMDYKYEELDEILEEAITKRDEFASAMEGKKYDGTDNNIVENRMEFLSKKIEMKKQEKETLQQKIRNMDTTMVQELMTSIASTKEYREHLKTDIEEYKKVMEENNEYKTPKKKANLNAAFHRKCEELNQIENIIESYEKDLEEIVECSKKLESEDLENLTNEINNLQEEIKSYEKLKFFANPADDILAIEKDKTELKKLSDEVSKIEHRKKYLKTPSEIYDEIEISMASLGQEEEKKEETAPVNLNDYLINDIEEEKEDENKISESEEIELPEIPSIEIPTPEEKDTTQQDEDLDEFKFPPRATVISQSPSLIKVISVEPIEEEKTEVTPPDVPEPVKIEPLPTEPGLISTSTESDDFMVNNEFEDTDYISFNDLLEGSKKNED